MKWDNDFISHTFGDTESVCANICSHVLIKPNETNHIQSAQNQHQDVPQSIKLYLYLEYG